MCRLRHYPSTLTPSLIDNDVEESTILTLMRVVKRNAPLCQRYFQVKASLLGVERLGNWDLRAPLPHASDEVRSWDEAKELLVDVYSGFDPQYGRWVREMFDLRRMDGEVRKGKRTGAFCDTWVNGRSAFILSSYNGQLNDIYTLAHELGHGVHAYLYTRAQNPSNCHISQCVAECGSMFGELLLTERLLGQARRQEERKELLVKVLNSFTQVVFQEGFRFFFEMGWLGPWTRDGCWTVKRYPTFGWRHNVRSTGTPSNTYRRTDGTGPGSPIIISLTFGSTSIRTSSLNCSCSHCTSCTGSRAGISFLD
jgi:oligoendopeptidase F